MNSDATGSTLVLPVFRGEDFVVTSGANQGDPLADEAELNLTDVYRLHASANRRLLSISGDGNAHPFRVADGSEIGHAGAELHLDCCGTFMCPDGSTVEVLIIVETDDGLIAATYMMPLAAVKKRTDHTLVAIDRDKAVTRFANLGCVSFVRGTHIALSDGRQVRIEDLQTGDLILTRDHGPQAIRWIGQQTVRAVGAFAPIRIAPGVLNNDGPLTLAPNHRLFLYQRQDHLGAGRAEVMVRASELINGDTVAVSEGGFVDYFQLLFDRHEIIYAEGIAAESLLAAPHIRSALPRDIRDRLKGPAPDKDPMPRLILTNSIDEATRTKPDASTG